MTRDCVHFGSRGSRLRNGRQPHSIQFGTMDPMIRFPWVRIAPSAFFFALLSGVLTSPAFGQETDFAVGSRLRITATCDSGRSPPAEADPVCSSTGNLISLEQDSLTVEASNATFTYAISDLVRAEVGDGIRSYKWVGAGIGGVAGATATYLVLNSGGSTSLCNQSENQDATSMGVCIGLTVLGGLAGAGLGSIVGGLITVEQWREVSLGSLRVGVRVHLGG